MHRKLRLFVLGTLFVLLALIVLSLTSLRERTSNLDDADATGPIWFLTGVEFDLLQLELALSSYSIGRVGPGDAKLRFDILWSRLRMTQKGGTAEQLGKHQVDRDVLDRLFALLKANNAYIVNLPEQIASISKMRDFIEELEIFNPKLRNLSLDVLQSASRASKTKRVNLAILDRHNSILTEMVISAIVVLGALQLLESAQTKNTLKEKECLSKDAMAAVLAKSQFISVINHELRTPLSSIRGAVTLLNAGAAGTFPDKAKKLLDMAQKNAEQLSLLIEDILDIENLIAGRYDLKMESVEMDDLITRELPNLRAYAKASEVTVVLNIQDRISPIMVDVKRIRQVLSNLVHNAVKFSKAGSTISIEVKQSTDTVVISVSDEGIGIPDTALPKIFDSFYQVDSSDTRNAGGAGLGLSIVKKLVEAMNSRVSVISKVGHGTTFYVLVPVTLADATTNDLQAAS